MFYPYINSYLIRLILLTDVFEKSIHLKAFLKKGVHNSIITFKERISPPAYLGMSYKS